jgi:hypothetical protein
MAEEVVVLEGGSDEEEDIERHPGKCRGSQAAMCPSA